MAWPGSLNQTEQNQVADFVRLCRSWSGEQARVNNHGDAINTAYNGGLTTLLGTLVDGDVIPDRTGLDGAGELTKAETITLVSHIQGVLANYNTAGHRQAWAEAAGAGNLIG